MKGWIDLETAAETLAQRSRKKAFRSLEKGEAKKVLRELRDLIVAGLVLAEVEGDLKQYRQLTSSNALSQPFGIHLKLDGTIGAETVFHPGELRPMQLREAEFQALFKPKGSSDGVVFLTRENLKARGIKFSNPHLLELEEQKKFPKRKYLSTKTVVWIKSEVEAWIEDRIASG